MRPCLDYYSKLLSRPSLDPLTLRKAGLALLDECRRLQGALDSVNGGNIEKLHTAYMCGEMVDRYLVDRDDLADDERKLAEQAMDSLCDLYQLIGSKM